MKFDKLRKPVFLVLLIFMMGTFVNAEYFCSDPITDTTNECYKACHDAGYTQGPKCCNTCDDGSGTKQGDYKSEGDLGCVTGGSDKCCCRGAPSGSTTATTSGGGGSSGGTISASELSGPIITVACLLYDVVIGIAGAIGSLIIAFSGLKWVMSADDPGARKQAKDTIIHTVVGLVIILAAAKIVEAIASSTTSFKGCP